jgi:hypothetical protein
MFTVQRVLEAWSSLLPCDEPMINETLQRRQHSALRATTNQAGNLATREPSGRLHKNREHVALEGGRQGGVRTGEIHTSEQYSAHMSAVSLT